MAKDEYRELYVNEEFDRNILVSAIKPFIRLTENGKIVYLENFEGLSDGRKIVAILLAKKVLMDDDKIESERVHVNDLVTGLGKKRNSIEGQIYGPLKDLIDVKQGEILIPNYKIKKAKKFLGI